MAEGWQEEGEVTTSVRQTNRHLFDHPPRLMGKKLPCMALPALHETFAHLPYSSPDRPCRCG